VAGLLIPDSEIAIRNVGINPTRSGLLNILKTMGADITRDNERVVSGEHVADIYVKHTSLTGVIPRKEGIGSGILISAIDEFPVLCVAAAKARGITKITGVRELRVKESDRIASMASELQKMGVKVEELEDGIIIEGRDNLKPAVINSYGDHRVAMSMVIAGLTASGETTIEDTDCVNTSFPRFMDMIESLSK
jgi:3-phosphoshikimate 1-carboxyvinyltransferase